MRSDECVCYPIVDVTTWVVDQDEQMGSKEKGWRINPEDGGRWLFKLNRRHENRQHPGEDWSEKIASEAAELLGLPHARVELAVGEEGRPGIITRNFVTDPERLRLTHGNELMARVQADYPVEQCRGVRCYSVEAMLSVFETHRYIQAPRLEPGTRPYPRGVESAADVLVGYLMLDALVGNTDRHHENWAILEHQRGPGESPLAELAPTFDHASSLGRELTDRARQDRLARDDARSPGAIANYAAKAVSHFHDPSGHRRLAVGEAFQVAARLRGAASDAWLERLDGLSDRQLSAVADRVPDGCITTPARLFAQRTLYWNRHSLRQSLHRSPAPERADVPIPSQGRPPGS